MMMKTSIHANEQGEMSQNREPMAIELESLAAYRFTAEKINALLWL